MTLFPNWPALLLAFLLGALAALLACCAVEWWVTRRVVRKAVKPAALTEPTP